MAVFPGKFANGQFSVISVSLNWVIHSIEITLQQVTLRREEQAVFVVRAPALVRRLCGLA